MARISFSYKPFTLELKHQFTVSSYSRNTTPLVLVTLEYEGLKGYGEASMPPYLGESQESVMNFLSKINLGSFQDPLDVDTILDYVDAVGPGNNAAKAAIDIALHDLYGKLKGEPLHKIWGLDPENAPQSSLTIGIDQPAEMAKKASVIKDFGLIKIKLGTPNDKEIVTAIRNVTLLPIMADVNQGWTNREHALEMCYWLKEHGVILLEQPLPKEDIDNLAWLLQQSPVPIIADEGVKRLEDLEKSIGIYNGVNIKLMKSTGLREARKMMDTALKHNLLLMIGCMTETSCAVAAASQLSPLCHYADLDGSFLVKNNPFEELHVKNGKVVIPSKPGIGVDKTEL